jgi:ABC-2 type transport system permease protein
LKNSFTRFCKRNLAFFKLAIATNLEYRLNYFSDAILQPIVAVGIETCLWIALFASANSDTIGGFHKDDYLAYVIWSAFIVRITVTWMYEFRMIEEINSGTLNSLLTRPLSFFEYYLSQFLGYKIVTTLISLVIPVIAVTAFGLPTILSRLPAVLALIFYYLLFVQMLSFTVATTAFHLNRVSSLTAAKNFLIWMVSGELIPLDLFPEPFKTIIINLPFANSAYVPVAYMTGRIGTDQFLHGVQTATIAIIFMTPVCILMWKWGMSRYEGTGA